jgi:hypothetical protein
MSPLAAAAAQKEVLLHDANRRQPGTGSRLGDTLLSQGETAGRRNGRYRNAARDKACLTGRMSIPWARTQDRA